MPLRPFLIPTLCAAAALAGCGEGVRISSTRSENSDAKGVLKVVETLQCPQTMGSLTRKGSASAGGTVCTYVGPKGAEVTLQLVALDGATPANVLKTFEQRLSADLPRAMAALDAAEARAQADAAAVQADAAGAAADTAQRAADTALAAADEAAAIWRPHAGAGWIDLLLAELELLAGRALIALDRGAAAVPRLEAAIATLEPIAAASLASLPRHLLVRARIALARAQLPAPPP